METYRVIPTRENQGKDDSLFLKLPLYLLHLSREKIPPQKTTPILICKGILAINQVILKSSNWNPMSAYTIMAHTFGFELILIKN